jgi:hypothetical protein
LDDDKRRFFLLAQLGSETIERLTDGGPDALCLACNGTVWRRWDPRIIGDDGDGGHAGL